MKESKHAVHTLLLSKRSFNKADPTGLLDDCSLVRDVVVGSFQAEAPLTSESQTAAVSASDSEQAHRRQRQRATENLARAKKRRPAASP